MAVTISLGPFLTHVVGVAPLGDERPRRTQCEQRRAFGLQACEGGPAARLASNSLGFC